MGRNGEPSRRSVLDAVGRIVTERGLEGIRVREIATEAKLSPGAVLYHYPKQAALLFAVHSDTVAQYIEGRRNAASAGQPPTHNLLAVMRAGVPPWANEHMVRLLYEMHGLARRSELHAELLSDLWIAERDLYAQIIEAGTSGGLFTLSESAAITAAQLLALEDGLVLHQVSRNEHVNCAAVLATFAAAASTLLSNQELVTITQSFLEQAPCEGKSASI